MQRPEEFADAAGCTVERVIKVPSGDSPTEAMSLDNTRNGGPELEGAPEILTHGWLKVGQTTSTAGAAEAQASSLREEVAAETVVNRVPSTLAVQVPTSSGPVAGAQVTGASLPELSGREQSQTRSPIQERSDGSCSQVSGHERPQSCPPLRELCSQGLDESPPPQASHEAWADHEAHVALAVETSLRSFLGASMAARDALRAGPAHEELVNLVAQWAVDEVEDPVHFHPEQLFTSLLNENGAQDGGAGTSSSLQQPPKASRRLRPGGVGYLSKAGRRESPKGGSVSKKRQPKPFGDMALFPMPVEAGCALPASSPRPPPQPAEDSASVEGDPELPPATARIRFREPSGVPLSLQLPGSDVILHLYHVDSFTGLLNRTVLLQAEAPIYHVGVQVYDREWYFQYYENLWDNTAISGVRCCTPMQAPRFDFVRSIPVGRTPMSMIEASIAISVLGDEWPSSQYHITHRNCVHFAEALVGRLQCSRPFPQCLLSILQASQENGLIDTIVNSSWEVSKWAMMQKHQQGLWCSTCTPCTR